MVVRGQEFLWACYESDASRNHRYVETRTEFLDIHAAESSFRVIVRVDSRDDHECLSLGPLLVLDGSGVEALTGRFIGKRIHLRPRITVVREPMLQNKHVERIVQWLLSDGFRPIKSDLGNGRVPTYQKPNQRMQWLESIASVADRNINYHLLVYAGPNGIASQFPELTCPSFDDLSTYRRLDYLISEGCVTPEEVQVVSAFHKMYDAYVARKGVYHYRCVYDDPEWGELHALARQTCVELCQVLSDAAEIEILQRIIGQESEFDNQDSVPKKNKRWWQF